MVGNTNDGNRYYIAMRIEFKNDIPILRNSSKVFLVSSLLL